jgi:short-subunit dehydrogenase
LAFTKDVDKKPVLITGCSSGIGYHCAKELSKDSNYALFATARDDEDIERLQGEGIKTLKLDLTNSQNIKECVDEFLTLNGGRIYALFNNGAFGQPGAVEDLRVEVLKEQFETNLFGTHELTRYFIPIMRQQGYGKIVQNSSVLGFVSLRFRGAYNASKYALEGLSDTMRLELIGSGVSVSLIEPGPIRSSFRKNALAKFIENIDQESSFFKDEYKDKLKSLQSTKDVPFTLGEDSVYRVFKGILTTKYPKARYRITKVTHIFWFLKRILSSRVLDRVLRVLD